MRRRKARYKAVTRCLPVDRILSSIFISILVALLHCLCMSASKTFKMQFRRRGYNPIVPPIVGQKPNQGLEVEVLFTYEALEDLDVEKGEPQQHSNFVHSILTNQKVLFTLYHTLSLFRNGYCQYGIGFSVECSTIDMGCRRRKLCQYD